MGRFWSILFLLVPVLGVLAFVLPMADIWPFQGHWLPQDVSANGYVIDNLFYFILILTGVIFIATSLVLFWFLWKYDAEKNPEPVKYMHGSHSLEVIWSIIPSVALLFIAIYQMDAWADAKMKRPTINVGGAEVLKPPLAEVTGRQFEWRIRYAGEDGLIGTEDDVHTVNDLRIPLNEETVLLIKSQDVLHSFFLPNLRIKQDVVPGMKQFVWFKATQTGQFDIVCAELCGWGHYKMRGRVTVAERSRFDSWLESVRQEQNLSEYAPSAGGE